MKFETASGYFQSWDKLELFYRHYSVKEPKALLIVLHGHGEHSGRYDALVRGLDLSNLDIALFDFRGSGQSHGRRVYVDSFDDYLNDVTAFLEFLQARFQKHLPVICLGHSVGGLIAVCWALRNPESLAGLILSSPCFGIKIPFIIELYNNLLNRYWPRFVHQNPVYPPFLTHDPEVVDRYRHDALIQRKMSARLVSELIRVTRMIQSKDKFVFPMPVALLEAEKEYIVDHHAITEFGKKIDSPDFLHKVYPGFYHEIFQEIGKEKVFSDVAGFISRIIETH